MGASKLAEDLKLAEELHISVEAAKEVAQDYIDRYLDTYPGVRRYMEEVLASCRRNEYVMTWLRRKRRLPSINSSDGYSKSQAQRQTLNSIIQGTAADIVMLAMIECEHDEVLKNLGCGLLMQVHDELVFEVPEENVDVAIERIKNSMEQPFIPHFSVPVRVSSGVGNNWAEAK